MAKLLLKPVGGTVDNKIRSKELHNRTIQLAYLTLLTIFANIPLDIVNKNWEDLIYLSVTTLLLFATVVLSKKGKDKEAASILIMTISLLSLLLVWNGDGLYDLSLLIFPTILIFSGLLGTFRISIFLVILFSINILLLGYAESNNLIIFSATSHGLTRALPILIIFIATASTIGILSNDYKTLFEKLKGEVKKVNDSKDEIHFIANHDSLTSLPNRTLAVDRFNHAKKLVLRNNPENKIALIYIDLDDFKMINESLGHDSGDEYLVAVSNKLKQSVRDCDTVCRLGGDEFLIIAEEITDVKDVSTIATSILKKLAESVSILNHDLSYTGSIGISIFPTDGADYDELVKKADIAMYRSKDDGRNAFHFYNSSMNVSVLERISLLEDLRVAVKNKEFFLAYQPVVDINTEKIIGAEALIRWPHKDRGFVSPEEFISVAEKSGLIVEIGAWVLEQACLDSYNIQEEIDPDFHIAINVSPVQISRDNFPKRVVEVLEKYPLNDKTLEFELTESEMVSDSPIFNETLSFFKENDIAISIDDFGTGYSNLSYLQNIKASKLKVDRCFVADIDTSSDNNSIVCAVGSMSKGLKMKTVAEGIERKEELAVIREIGLTYGQGYYWSKPVKIDEFRALLKKSTPKI
jgi:diguanylate cyclase (GGDEF)-like protein